MPDAPEDRERRAHRHAVRFNAAVTSGDWAGFVRSFTTDARLSFTNAPVPSADGREAILAAYTAQPPDESLQVLDVSADPSAPEVDLVRFAWASGGLGTMRIRWSGDLVAALVVSFG